MRILYITDSMSIWGGIERVIRDKTTFLVNHYGYDVHIVTVNQSKLSIPFPFDIKVKFHDLNVHTYSQYKYRGIKRLKKTLEVNYLFYKRLKKLVSDIKPDIIVCVKLELANITMLVRDNIPFIFESHTMCRFYNFENTSLFHRFLIKFTLLRLRNADCIVALTDGDANDWLKFNDNVCVIPNIVQLNPNNIYSSLSSKIAIFVGRFEEQKDIGSLIDIWRLVNNTYPEWELHIYGEGKLKRYFEKLVKGLNIRIFPPTPNIFEKYIDSSMLLMTSLYEPFGLVLPEAMSCGLPVIAFNCPYGPSDIIANNINGFLINNRNVESFAQHVSMLIDNTLLRKKFGKASISLSSRYEASIIMLKWKELFEQYINHDVECE